MAWITVANQELKLTLTRGEKIAGLHGDIRVPVSAVRDVRVAPDALAAARGLRAPGLALPGRVKIGTWRGGGRRFIVARRGIPAVHVFLEGAHYDELVVSLPGAERVAAGLRGQLGLPPGDDSVRELQVSVPVRGGRLAGALMLPAGPGPYPAALLLPGSGPIDRDADLPRMPLGVSRDLARALAERGVATLRYDKRGVGASDGSFLETGLLDNVDDARDALNWLRAREEVRGEVVLIGHSEGALLATALGDEPLAGVVLLAGSAKTGMQTLAWQTRQIAAGLPRPVKLLLRVLRVDVAAKQAKNVNKLRATTTDVARVGPRKVNARWHRELFAFDPAPMLSRMRAPVLALTGAKDIQVDPADLEQIAELSGAETVCVPDLTHLLRRDPGTPSVSAYKRLVREPIDPEVVRTVGDWVAGRFATEAEHAGQR